MKHLTLLFCLTTVQAAGLVPVTMVSEPSKAWIEIENMPCGRTPSVLKLAPGQYRVRIRLNGFDTWTGKITVQDGQTNEIKAELKPQDTLKPVKPAAPPPVVSTDGLPPSSKAPYADALRRWTPPSAAKPEAVTEPERPAPPAEPPEVQDVTYTVQGAGEAWLVIGNASGGKEEITVRLPWSRTFKARRGQSLSFSAEKPGREGTIVSMILTGGKPLRRASTSAAYGVAAVSARLP